MTPKLGKAGTDRVKRRDVRAVAVCVAMAGLAACAPPPPPPELSAIGIRPGIGSGAPYAVARLEPGGTLRLEQVEDIAGFSSTLDMEVVRGPGDGVALEGAVRLRVDNADAEGVARALIPEGVEVPFEVRGDSILLPLRVIMDDKGRTKFYETVDATIGYAPHDCWAMLGTCRYSEIALDGEVVHAVVETTETDGIWRAEARTDPAKTRGRNRILTQKVFSVDESLLPIDLRIRDFRDKPASLTLIRRIQ